MDALIYGFRVVCIQNSREQEMAGNRKTNGPKLPIEKIGILASVFTDASPKEHPDKSESGAVSDNEKGRYIVQR